MARIEKLRDNVYRILNTGSNCTVFITEPGVVMIESGYPGWGREILDKLKTVTDNLAQGPWMLGEKFSAADVLWGTALGWTTKFGLVPHTPVVDAYISRVDARPAVVRTRTKEAELAAAQGR